MRVPYALHGNLPVQLLMHFCTVRPLKLTQATSSSVMAGDGCLECHASSTEISPFFNFANHLKVCILPIGCSPNAILST